MTHDEIIAVVQAHKAGGKIYASAKGCGTWSYMPEPHWDFEHCDYKAMPTKREAWVIVYDGVVSSKLYEWKETAEQVRRSNGVGTVAHIEWEE